MLVAMKRSVRDTSRLRRLALSRSNVRRLALGGALAFLAATLYVAVLWWRLPDLTAIRGMDRMAQATTVFDRNDHIAFTLYTEQRIVVPLDQISPNLRKAVVAIEDHRFYQHHGFDVVRIGAAALTDLRHLGFVEGASTITQQLAKLSFLSPERTIGRKLQELMLAARIEHTFTKDQILEMYLNKVFFGDGLYGAEAAARGYFDEHASELTVSQAALLAGLVKSPVRYAPTENLHRALERRDLVLQAMLDTGAIDRTIFDQARASHVTLHDGLQAPGRAGYAKAAVLQELLDRFGAESVYEKGLRVYTTLDMDMQLAAEKAVAASLDDVTRRRAAWLKRSPRRAKVEQAADATNPLQAALLALDPDTGAIRAMVGGRDFRESAFNRAVQARRQPGSAFKPFVYAAALESGFTPATLITHLDDPIPTPAGDWTPDDGHVSGDAITLRDALRVSSNRAAVHLVEEVGIPRAVRFAQSMGVGEVPSVPSMALGAGDVTLESMTAAYSAFINGGMVPHPLLIRRVESRDGTLLYQAQPSSTRVIQATTAFLMADMLAGVVNAGTGSGVRQLGFTLPAGGKTGTTNSVRDAWFVGFTPHLATGVWVGFDQPRTILPNGFASNIAVPLWTAFMKTATRRDAPDWIAPPPGITTADVCRLSGKLATDGCRSAEVVGADGQLERVSTAYTEYFVEGTEPTTYCDLHPSRSFAGRLASLFSGGGPPSPPPAVNEPHDPGRERVGPVTDSSMPPPPPRPRKKRGFWARLFGIGR